MHKNNFDVEVAAIQAALDKWAEEQRKIHQQLCELRKREEAFARILMNKKPVNLSCAMLLDAQPKTYAAEAFLIGY